MCNQISIFASAERRFVIEELVQTFKLFIKFSSINSNFAYIDLVTLWPFLFPFLTSEWRLPFSLTIRLLTDADCNTVRLLQNPQISCILWVKQIFISFYFNYLSLFRSSEICLLIILRRLFVLQIHLQRYCKSINVLTYMQNSQCLFMTVMTREILGLLNDSRPFD